MEIDQAADAKTCAFIWKW